MITTIKIDGLTRDRLRRYADSFGETMGQSVERLLDQSDAIARVDALRAAIHSTAPDVMADYEAERDVWLHADLS